MVWVRLGLCFRDAAQERAFAEQQQRRKRIATVLASGPNVILNIMSIFTVVGTLRMQDQTTGQPTPQAAPGRRRE